MGEFEKQLYIRIESQVIDYYEREMQVIADAPKVAIAVREILQELADRYYQQHRVEIKYWMEKGIVEVPK